MFRIYEQANGDNHEAEILLYDTIADWDSENYGYVSAKTIVGKLKALSKETRITLRINSHGGDVFQAFAIYNTLMNLEAELTVKIDGIAASAASVIAMAGDKIIMPENSMLMLHNPWGSCIGDADVMRGEAELLDKIKESTIKAYQLKSGLATDKLSEIMNNETYLSAAECKELGLCDEVVGKLDVAAQVRNVVGCASSFSKDEVAKIQEGARLQERERIRALDGLRAPGRQEIIERAKYDEPKDVKDIALELLKADSVQSRISDYHEDARTLNDIQPSNERLAKQAFDNMVDAISMNLNKMRGYMNNGR